MSGDFEMKLKIWIYRKLYVYHRFLANLFYSWYFTCNCNRKFWESKYHNEKNSRNRYLYE